MYRYLWAHPYDVVIPDDCMPLDHQVYYIFEQVKNLRDGTDYPKLTLEELQDLMNEEQPGWRDNKGELPDWFLEKHGLDKPIMKY